MKLLSFLMLAMLTLVLMFSCSKDEESTESPLVGINVIVNSDGTTSNGSLFSAIDDDNFYLDYIKYTIEEDHLIVSGYDKGGFKGIAKIASKITIKGITYVVSKITNYSPYYGPFDYCEKMTEVIIPNSITSIGYGAFKGCTGLTSLSLPNSLTAIGEEAFSGCRGLKSITIPKSVGYIGDRAFNYTELTSIKVESENEAYDSRGNCNAIIEKETNTLIRGCSKTVIPNSVSSIGHWAFAGDKEIVTITIPSSITSIGAMVFTECRNLTSMHCKCKTPPSLNPSQVGFPSTIYIPYGSLSAYKSAWGTYYNFIEE